VTLNVGLKMLSPRWFQG